jgi:hypothetical protein
MKNVLLVGVVVLMVAGLALVVSQTGRAAEEVKGGKMLAHMVYFSLNDATPAAKAKLVAACKKYLSGHPGTVFYAAGTLAEELNRPVNDRDFDVALHVIFKDKASQDVYQTAERHLKFIEENKDNWKKVRVFDSLVEQ